MIFFIFWGFWILGVNGCIKFSIKYFWDRVNLWKVIAAAFMSYWRCSNISKQITTI